MSSTEFLYSLLRWQFGLSASFHFLFVPLSMGLLLCVNLLQTAHVRTGHPVHERAARFWRNFFLLTWLAGFCTGYPLRWQLLHAWGGYAQAASKVLAEIFSIEGTVGPFMLVGVVITALGPKWTGRWLHMVVGWLLLLLLLMQSHTILSVNAWMQHPVGVSFTEGGWQLQSLTQVLLNDTALHKLWHTLSGAMLTGAFFVMALSATWLLRRQHMEVAGVSMKLGAWVGLLGTVSALWSGHVSALGVAQVQPMKFAAFEAHWQRQSGPAPLVLLALPDEQAGLNRHALEVPGMLSLLSSDTREAPPGILDLTRGYEQRLTQALTQPQAPHDEALLKLYAATAVRHADVWASWTPQERIAQTARAARPSVAGTFWAFRTMVAAGFSLMLLCGVAFLRREALAQGRCPWLLKTLRLGAPLPWIAIISGWAVAEMGRQPWVVQGQLPTFRAMQAPPLDQALSMAFLMLAGAVLLAVVYGLVWRVLFKGGPDGRRRQGPAGWSGHTSIMGA